MIVYSIIMFIVALAMIIVSICIYRGNTKLIHDYHQTHVSDKQAYAKAMGKALFCMSLSPIVSGIVAIFSSSLLPTIILILGLIISFIPLFLVQKKYNGSIF